MVDELHLKLRKVESSCEENAIIGRASNVVVPTSPVTSTSSRFYKNLKKIKRTHGSENPTKNYYLAFPALSSKKTTTTITSGGCKLSPAGGVGATNEDSNLQLLCWSSLMSSAKDGAHSTSASALDPDKFRSVVKIKRPRRNRRYGRHQSSSSKQTDVQCNAKCYDVYDGAAFSPKTKNVSKKHQRNQYGKKLDSSFNVSIQFINSTFLSSSVTSKNPKTCDAARNSNFSDAADAPKLDLPAGSSTIWDMDFKGQWEMERDLISEFIQQQHPHKISKDHPVDAGSTNQVEQAMDEEDDMMLMKFLPMKLMDDDADAGRNPKFKEAQSISSLKSKFDANVKALWNDVDDPLTKPLTHKSFDDGTASLVSSFASENNSLSLFNFNGHQPLQSEVIAPCTNLQLFDNSSADFLSVADFDCNNNNNAMNGGLSRGAAFTSLSVVSPGAEKFIKSGTNLQTSIWSDGEFASEPESLIYKDVSCHLHSLRHTRVERVKVTSRVAM